MLDGELTASRDPKTWYEWFCELNSCDPSFYPVKSDDEKDLELKACCVLFCNRSISLGDFLWLVLDLDLFPQHSLGPVLANLETQLPATVTRPDNLLFKVAAIPGWKNIFE